MGGRTVRITGGEGVSVVEVDLDEVEFSDEDFQSGTVVPTVGTPDSKLDELALGLTQVGQDREREAREPLLKTLAGFKGAEREYRIRATALGEALTFYAEVYKEHKLAGGPIRNFRGVLMALGVSKSDGYRCLTAYKVATIPGMTEAALAEGIDLSLQKHSKLANRVLTESAVQIDMGPAELLKYCRDAIERERKAGEAPTIAKATGPLPDRRSASGKPDYAAQVKSLKDQFKSRFADENEAEDAINQIVIAALTAQLAKLPEKVAA